MAYLENHRGVTHSLLLLPLWAFLLSWLLAKILREPRAELLAAVPALAVTSQEKMETCKVGAESQQFEGAKRSAFIKKCMAQGNYEPAARKNAKNSFVRSSMFQLNSTPATAASPVSSTSTRSRSAGSSAACTAGARACSSS